MLRLLGLEIGSGPFLVLFLEFTLDPGDGEGCPDASPEKWKDPSDLYVVSIEMSCKEVACVRTT